MTKDIEFGFLRDYESYSKTDYFEIKPNEDHGESIENIEGSGQEYQGWMYPPIKNIEHRKKTKAFNVTLSHRYFSMPVTHTLSLDEKYDVEWIKEFLILLFGFLKGVKLYPLGYVHFYKTPVNPYKLTSFSCTKEEIEKILSLGIDFCMSRGQDATKRIFGAIHWYLFAQSYEHPFEKFDGQYKVLDTLYKILSPNSACKHYERPTKLCENYGIPVPSWAIIKSKNCELSEIRNNLIHEALYAGMPIGFNVPDSNLELELRTLNSQLLLATLGVKAGFIELSVEEARLGLRSLDMTN